MLTSEYLQNVATLIKMTTFYESKLEEQRIKMSITPYFNAKNLFRLLDNNQNGISKQQIKQLFSNYLININDKELDYLFQLYSSDETYIIWDDYYQLICPLDMNLDLETKENVNNQVKNDLLIQFQRLLKIEIQFFRQAEPIRMMLFEKFKESGKQFCLLVENHNKIITNQNLITFMKRQQYTFNNQDIYCIKKRIRCLNDIITSDNFIKYCPLLPFQVMISRQPEYKLIQPKQQQLQQVPDIFKENECYVPQIPTLFITPIEQKEEIIPSIPIIKNAEISNYEFYTGKKPLTSGRDYLIKINDQQKTENNWKSPSPNRQLFSIQKDYSQKYLSPYQTIQQEKIDNYNENQNTLLDKFLRPTKSNEAFTTEQLKIVESNNHQPQIKYHPQQVETIHIPDISEQQQDILQEYLQPENKLDQTIDKYGSSQIKRNRIFGDELPPIPKMQQTLFDSSKIRGINESNQNDQTPMSQNQFRQKSKKYVSVTDTQQQGQFFDRQ